jgi:putative signal transducing protein
VGNDMNRHLATAANELEADMILARMSEAGIRAWPTSIGAFGRGGPRDIYVDEGDIDRARKALEASESVDEAELTELSEHSSPPPD